MSSSSSLAEALTEAARTINSPRSLEETLDAIVWATVHTVPGFDHVGISLTHRDGTIETKAGTDQLVWELDRLQYSLGEGPCVDSMRTAEDVIVVDHAARQQRWPRFIPAAAQAGLRSQLAMKLYDNNETLGGLNLYSTTSDIVPDDAVQAAGMFAAHAAIALGHARDRDHLNEALTSRQVVGQATGLVMQRYQIDETRAFDFLVRASATAQLKLRVIAQEVLDDANQKFSRTGATG